MTILTAMPWASNAELIEDVAKLGYLDGAVLDLTYGYGTFWKNWQPENFVASDINATKSPCGYSVDFCKPPKEWDGMFDAVVFDPPYRLNGTPDEDFDERYGTNVPTTWQERHTLIVRGLLECAHLTRRYVLLKCQDQVCSGKKRWQTFDFTRAATSFGLRLEDRFDMLTTPRPQPEGRRQVHSQQNYSTLLVFKKGS